MFVLEEMPRVHIDIVVCVVCVQIRSFVFDLKATYNTCKSHSQSVPPNLQVNGASGPSLSVRSLRRARGSGSCWYMVAGLKNMLFAFVCYLTNVWDASSCI